MNSSRFVAGTAQPEADVARAMLASQVSAPPALPARVAGVVAPQLRARRRGLAPAQQQAILALQRGAGNAAVAQMLQRTCACEHAPSPAVAYEECATCAGGDATASGGVCASCEARDLEPPRALAARSMSRRMIQRDAAAKQKVSDAIKNNAAGPGGADPGYEEAFRILNGLPMYDMLSTLSALKRAGQLDALDKHFKSAIGVYVARLGVAFDAVLAKGAIQADAFALAHKGVMEALPIDQRQDIIKYLDPSWFDELKVTEDAESLITAIRATTAYLALAPATRTLTEEIVAEAKKNPGKVVYYMTKLKLLFDTPTKPPGQIGTETSAATSVAEKEEQKRIAAPAGAKNAGLEEKASRDPKRTYIPIRGKFGGGTYYVDKTDPTNIVVKASIFLKPTATSVSDAAAITKMEDACRLERSDVGHQRQQRTSQRRGRLPRGGTGRGHLYGRASEEASRDALSHGAHADVGLDRRQPFRSNAYRRHAQHGARS